MVDTKWLKKISIFRDVPEEGLSMLGGFLESRKYSPGEVVYTENEKGGNLYIVRRGLLKVYRTPKARNMSEVELARLTEKDIFGELSFLDEGVHTANISAVEESEIYVLAKGRFEVLAERDPRSAYLITRNLLLVIESIIRKMNAEYVSMMEYLYVYGK